jgi:hypothetical protein
MVMGMSTHITAYKDPSEHDKHVKVLEVCREAGVSVPRETAAYFGDDSEGISPEAWSHYEIEERLETSLGSAVSEWGDDYRSGYEIDVDALPKDVKKIRFYNSY